MKMLNPKNYDFLWSDHDINFIFVSCYLFKEFKEADIILIYDWHNKELEFFLSKKDREKFSKFGFDFFRNNFSSWKRKIEKNISKGEELIQGTRELKKKIKTLTNSDLREKILERVKFFQNLGGNYFYTEFFFMDKVEKLDEIKRKELNLNEKLKEMGKLKFKAREVLNEFYNYNKIFKPFIREVSARFGRQDMEWLSYEEILKIIDGKTVSPSNRDKMFWVIAKKSGWKLIDGEKALKIKNRFENYFFNRRVIEFKGVVANKGYCRGKVKIIRVIFSDNINKEMKKMEKGDILVAPTTGPETMTACRLAGAIVTDEGGITSHAAIVSRELRIPCIIAVKTATKILKDGDLVEVNTDKGVVKILKRAKK